MSEYSYSDNDSDLESIEERIVTKKKSSSNSSALGTNPSASASGVAAAASSSKKAIDSDIDDDELVDTDTDDDESISGVIGTSATGKSAAKKVKDYNSGDSSGDEFSEDENEFDELEGQREEDEEILDEELSAAKKSSRASAVSSTAKKSTRFDATLFEEDDDEEDEVYGKTEENYLEKFDKKIRENIIAEYYPELIQQNYDEVSILATVVRDEDGMICDPLHTTIPFMTKYEKSRILGERARQINSGSLPMVQVEDELIDGYLIALKELEQKKIPFIIKRPLPSGSVEYWRIEDLEII